MQFKFIRIRIDVRTKPIIESIRSVRVPRVSKFVVVELGGSFIADQTDCIYIRYVTLRYIEVLISATAPVLINMISAQGLTQALVHDKGRLINNAMAIE